MNAKLLAAILGLLLVISLCLHLVLWLHVRQLRQEVQDLRSRPSIVIPGRTGFGGGMHPE